MRPMIVVATGFLLAVFPAGCKKEEKEKSNEKKEKAEEKK